MPKAIANTGTAGKINLVPLVVAYKDAANQMIKKIGNFVSLFPNSSFLKIVYIIPTIAKANSNFPPNWLTTLLKGVTLSSATVVLIFGHKESIATALRLMKLKKI